MVYGESDYVTHPKMVTSNQFVADMLRRKTSGAKIVFTNGCFDILHAGHIASLDYAASLGNILVVGINSDKSIKLLKGHCRPVVPQFSRCIVIATLELVDYVIIFDDKTPERLVAEIRPDYYVKGGDYKVNELTTTAGECIASTSTLVDNISTTILLDRYVDKVNYCNRKIPEII